MNLPVTKPGYQVVFPSFIAVFIAGSRKELEERNNWHNMMKDLLYACEMWPGNMARVGTEAAYMWMYSSILDINIKYIRVEISNDTFSGKPGDRIKTVFHVHLTDHKDIQSMLTFEVKKKKEEMKMLQTLAAETISSCVSKKEDIEYLELPKQLQEDLNKAYDGSRVDRKSISISKHRGTFKKYLLKKYYLQRYE